MTGVGAAAGISVLVVEDEHRGRRRPPRPRRARARPTVAAVARTGRAALRVLGSTPVDLVLLDLHLPDLHGLEVCRRARAAGLAADVIAVTSARDLDAVRAATSAGVVQYVLKPFTFRVLTDKLERYRSYREALSTGGAASGQRHVDQVLASLRGVDVGALPAGLSEETLGAVVAALQGAGGGLSAAQVAGACGTSRVTARRYLEHLAESGAASRAARYGGVGRPEVEYCWRALPSGS